MNCAAIPTELIETELFGHEKGAFTGATAARRGKFELADGGTIFLDEVGDLHGASQAKLLRVLQEGEFHRVGGEQIIRVKVRVISATNRDLAGMVTQEKFREDLYYRLSVVPIRVPALRERPHDIRLLAEYFLEDFCARNNFKPKMLDESVFPTAGSLRLARQRARAAQRDRADGDPDPRRAADARLASRSSCGCSARRARSPPSRKRANRPSASTFCGRWRNPTGTCRARRARWGWSGQSAQADPRVGPDPREVDYWHGDLDRYSG